MDNLSFSRRDLLKTSGAGLVGTFGSTQNVVGAPETGGESIGYGDVVFGALTENSPFDEDYNGYHEVYTFEGMDGDLISIEMRPDTEDGVADGDHAVQFLVYDPDGERVTREEPTIFGSGATGVDRLELEADGEYTVVATTARSLNAIDPYNTSEDSYFDTFSYELRLHEGLGDPEGELAYGSTTEDELEAGDNFQDPSTDLNGFYKHYTFDGSDSDLVSIEMRPDTEDGVADEDHAVQFLVYDPDGERVTREEPTIFGSGATGVDRLELEADGEYTVVATTARSLNAIDPYGSLEDSFFDAFSYELRLHEGLGDAEEHLEYGSSIGDQLEDSDNFQDPSTDLNGFYKHYTFDGAERDRIYVSMIPEAFPGGNNHAVQLRLYGPEGERVTSGEPTDIGYGATSLDEVELEADGEYTVVATTARSLNAIDSYGSLEDSYFDTFEYDLQLNRIADNVEREIEFGDTFTDQLTPTDSYADELVGYHKRYTFEGAEGEMISAEMRVAIPGEQAAHLQLYGPTGEQIADEEAEDGQVQLDRVELEASGTHTVVATTASEFAASVYDSTVDARTDTPSYQFRLYEFVGERELLTDGDTVQAIIEPEDNFQETFVGFYDAYVTTATEGDSLSVEMNIDQADDNAAQLILLGPDGSSVASTNESMGHADLSTTINETGEYTVIATSEDQFTADVYETAAEAEQATFQYELVFDGPANAPPLVDDVHAAPSRAAIGETVDLSVEATDPNDGPLEYQWEQVIGAFPDPEVDITDAESSTATFEAPDVDADTELTFAVTVSDGDGGAVTEDISMLVDPEKEADSVPDPGDPDPGGEHPSGVSEELFEAVDQDDTGELSLSELRDAIADWQADGRIDDADATLGDLRNLVEWWQV